MKASELIVELQQAIEKYGDLHVCMEHEYDYAPAPVSLIGVAQGWFLKKGHDSPHYFSFWVDADAETIFPRSSESRWAL